MVELEANPLPTYIFQVFFHIISRDSKLKLSNISPIMVELDTIPLPNVYSE